MTAWTTGPALSSEDKQKVAAYTSRAYISCRASTGASSKNISEGLGHVAVFRGLPDSHHLVPHHQSHESEGCQREVRPGSSGVQRARTPTDARRSFTQAGDRTAIADLLATTKDAKYSTDECRTQQRRTAVADLLDATRVIAQWRPVVFFFFACVLPLRCRMERWCGRCGVTCQPRGLCDRGREMRGFSSC